MTWTIVIDDETYGGETVAKVTTTIDGEVNVKRYPGYQTTMQIGMCEQKRYCQMFDAGSPTITDNRATKVWADIILESPNGTLYRLKVADNGDLSTEEVV